MTGVKGKSGGARRGAGRKPKPPVQPAVITSEMMADAIESLDPRPVLEMVARGQLEVSKQQMEALKLLLPYVHSKKAQASAAKEKEKERQDALKGGRFTRRAPPPVPAMDKKVH